jgi:hypothetical protein
MKIINFMEGCAKIGRTPRPSYHKARSRAFWYLENEMALLEVINRYRVSVELNPVTLADIIKRGDK